MAAGTTGKDKVRLATCSVCESSYEWEKRECPNCGTPNPAHELPEMIKLQVEIPVEVWRALVKLATAKGAQPNQIIVDVVEREISNANRAGRRKA